MATDSLRTGHIDSPASKRGVKALARHTARPSRVRAIDAAAQVHHEGVNAFQTRHRRRRAHVEPMYTSVVVRVLSRREAPMEGHVLDISETGVAVQVDYKLSPGTPVALEFRVAGLGRVVGDQWTEFAAAGEVVRLEDVRDFPMGPYRVAVKFVRIATMAQAHIARYVATHS